MPRNGIKAAFENRDRLDLSFHHQSAEGCLGIIKFHLHLLLSPLFLPAQIAV